MFDLDSLFTLVDLFGVFIGAFSGALLARRERYDITGLWWVALVSGLGGGLIRDVLLQAGPPLALIEPTYLPTVLIATGCGAVFGKNVDLNRRTIQTADAIALATFAVAGSLRTYDAGLATWPVILLGVLTAIGGGMMRDMLMGVTPMVFRQSELYGLAALTGCVAVVVSLHFDVPRSIVILIGISVGLAMRLASLRFGWMSWAPR